jgi:hypothetical protein
MFRKRSWYSDWLRAGRQRGWGSSAGRVKNFLFSTSSRAGLGYTQPPIQWVHVALSPEVKRPGREADHSPPSSAEVKKMWIYTSPYAFAVSTGTTLHFTATCSCINGYQRFIATRWRHLWKADFFHTLITTTKEYRVIFPETAHTV